MKLYDTILSIPVQLFISLKLTVSVIMTIMILIKKNYYDSQILMFSAIVCYITYNLKQYRHVGVAQKVTVFLGTPPNDGICVIVQKKANGHNTECLLFVHVHRNPPAGKQTIYFYVAENGKLLISKPYV